MVLQAKHNQQDIRYIYIRYIDRADRTETQKRSIAAVYLNSTEQQAGDTGSFSVLMLEFLLLWEASILVLKKFNCLDEAIYMVENNLLYLNIISTNTNHI